MAENNVLNKNTTRICLSQKSYSDQVLIYNDIELYNKKKISIPITLKLLYDNNIIFHFLDKRATDTLKQECTRALYFLLNKNNEEFFIFEKSR